jgi:hypothetical protein
MRQFVKAILCSLPIMALGCGFAQNTRRNIFASPLFAATEAVDHRRHLQMGREAWMEMAGAYPEYEYSCDYRRGFVDGFADYLDYGGTGEPPPVAPPIYRLSAYETPVGMQMAEDWMCGFRHGAATAKASGLRDLATLQVYKGPIYTNQYYGDVPGEQLRAEVNVALDQQAQSHPPVPPLAAPLPVKPAPPTLAPPPTPQPLPPVPDNEPKFESESK